jgi:hypothetical protein
MYLGLHVKYPLFLSDFKSNLNFLDRVWKNIQISNLMKIRSVGAGLSHADGQTTGGQRERERERQDGWTDIQTDMTKLIVGFRNFANAPKKRNKISDIN